MGLAGEMVQTETANRASAPRRNAWERQSRELYPVRTGEINPLLTDACKSH
jgi:hypothetical protein